MRAPDEQEPMSPADAAVRWFTRLQDEAASGDDWLAFEAWLAASPAHLAAYERLETIWLELEDAAGVVAEPSALRGSAAQPRRIGPRRSLAPTRRGWLAAGLALAASVLIAVGVGNWPPASSVTYATAPGETRKVVLADGTGVWLNAGSRLEVSLGRDARRVEMADGEALFDVTHDPARPFLITAGDRQVRVVGTRFNLRHRDGEFALTVSRGVVEVRPTGSAATPTRVMAGQSLVRRRGSATSVLSAASPDTAFAWTRGQLVYSDAPLSEVAADLSRSLGTPIRVADAATGQIPFTGVLALDDRTQVLRRLEAYAPVRAEQDPAGTVLRRR